jgi:hypothetical protein
MPTEKPPVIASPAEGGRLPADRQQAISSVRYQDLPPRARSYVDNLIAQRDEIFRKAGLPEGTTFKTITMEQTRMIDRRDYQRLKDIG